jgi:hypothetical protein
MYVNLRLDSSHHEKKEVDKYQRGGCYARTKVVSSKLVFTKDFLMINAPRNTKNHSEQSHLSLFIDPSLQVREQK